MALLIPIEENLETIKKTDGDFEYWSARELMKVLGYTKWENFVVVIERAKTGLEATGGRVTDHFPGVRKMIKLAKGAERKIDDYLLTRYACYLIAQNGDPRKPQIAYAQMYFAVQTRRHELAEQRAQETARLETRAKLKDTEKNLEGTIYERGITTGQDFATFKNKHITALYGGIGTSELKERRHIPLARALADFDSEVELKAKDFSLAMTDHNIRKNNLVGKPKLEQEVIANSKATRVALLERGIVPERLPAEEDLKLIEARRKREAALLGGEALERLETGDE